MKNTTKAVMMAIVLCLIAYNSYAQTSYVTPNYAGGYNIQTIDPNGGYSNTTVTPNYGGGYNVQTIDPTNGYGYSTISPNYAGGYTIQTIQPIGDW